MADELLEGELIAVLAILDEAGVANALCGGIAANLYRDEARATNDVDFYVLCSAPELVSIAKRFEERGWEAHPSWRKAELLRLDRSGHPRVDLLVASTDFEANAVERAVPFDIEGRTVRVLRAEDLIVFKLIAGRTKDYEAVEAMLNSNDDIKTEFIKQTLVEFGFDDRWQRAVDGARIAAEDLD